MNEFRTQWVKVCKQLNDYYHIMKDLKAQRAEEVNPALLKIFDELCQKIDGVMQEYLETIKENLNKRS